MTYFYVPFRDIPVQK